MEVVISSSISLVSNRGSFSEKCQAQGPVQYLQYATKKSMIAYPLILTCAYTNNISEPQYEISNNVVCATSNASDQPVHMGSLIRDFACHLNILLYSTSSF